MNYNKNCVDEKTANGTRGDLKSAPIVYFNKDLSGQELSSITSRCSGQA